MGNSKSGLAVFGLLIAFVGLALGGYAVFSIMTTKETTSIKGTWYDTVNAHITTHDTWEYIPGLEIEFTVNSGENVYIFYNSYIRVEGYVGYFEIHIDGSQVGYQMQVTSDDPSSGPERFSVALQHYIPASVVGSTIGYGNHTVSIYIYSTMGPALVDSTISSNSLFVQTFK